MSNGIPDKFNGYILPDGRCVSLEDEDALFKVITESVKDRKEVCGILRGLTDDCLRSGLLAAALSYLEKAFSLTDDAQGRSEILLAAGCVLERKRDYPSAAESYRAAFAYPKRKDETWYFLHNNLGFCLNQFGEYAEAEELCRAAIRIDGRRHNAYKNLGVALEGLGRHVDAAEAYLTAGKLNPRDHRALDHLEALVVSHPAITGEIPDIHLHIGNCRQAARVAWQ
jgi:tetratricopeptide (TPR) repeat protein